MLECLLSPSMAKAWVPSKAVWTILVGAAMVLVFFPYIVDGVLKLLGSPGL